MYPAVFIDEDLFEYLDQLPEDDAREIARAIVNLSFAKYRALAKNFADYGRADLFQLELEKYYILFSYPEPPRQPGGPKVVRVRGVAQKSRRMESADVEAKLSGCAWAGLIETARWLKRKKE